MNLFRIGVKRGWLFSGLLLLGLVPLAAQVPDPVTAAAAPVAGAGHSYIGQPGETVNPADGIPSFSLAVTLPGGRGGSGPHLRLNERTADHGAAGAAPCDRLARLHGGHAGHAHRE